MSSRRRFFAQAAGATLASVSTLHAGSTTRPSVTESASLCGEWAFAPDPHDAGLGEHWFSSMPASGAHACRQVVVPHTWQIEPALADYYGIAWYWRQFSALDRWSDSLVRIEFESVFHSATVWVNGKLAGKHLRKGYTAFSLDVTPLLRFGADNNIVVRVDNALNFHMVPRYRSSDWALDGGIVRPVQILVTPRTFVESVDVEANPEAATGNGRGTLVAHLRNATPRMWSGTLGFHLVDRATGLQVPGTRHSEALTIAPQSSLTRRFDFAISTPKLWHFDHPNLYEVEVSLHDAHAQHRECATFGVRQLLVKEGAFYLNGEQVQLVGVERMAGSDPRLGMAESDERIEYDMADLKHLNCVFSRAHWPQDRRVLDYCDRHGILMQCEVSAWGHETFDNMGDEPDADILENGLEQLREMIGRDRNHPCIIAWGLCNEIPGQLASAYQFTRRLLQEAKRLDPNRLCSYAANTLFATPQQDVAGLMDFIETNEYFGTWQEGTPADLNLHLKSLRMTFPDKPIVISEYGYCACAAEIPENDQSRIEILRSHNTIVRGGTPVSGAIFFCYNDYRTHIGDHGSGPLRQRFSGVVDLLGARKPSFDALRSESSPVLELSAARAGNRFDLRLRSRDRLPKYSMRGYRLLGTAYGSAGRPINQQEIELALIEPGSEVMVALTFDSVSEVSHIVFDVLRPTGHSAYSLKWHES